MQGSGRHSSGDGDEDGVGTQPRLAQHGQGQMGLHPEQHDLRPGTRRGIVVTDLHPELTADPLATGLAGSSGDNLVGAHDVGIQQAGENGGGHRATPQDGECDAGRLAHWATTSSASWTALRAAPLRRLSAVQKRTSP